MLPIEVVLFHLACREEQELKTLYSEQYRQYRRQTWF
jgi:protein-S-isoprenylcysteine O-methyltransferase Ste14